MSAVPIGETVTPATRAWLPVTTGRVSSLCWSSKDHTDWEPTS